MSWIRPPHISEREDAHRWPDGRWDDASDEDCLWCSILRQYLGANPGAAPATHEEAEALRATAGVPPTGPSNSLDGVRGTKARYGFEPTIIAAGIDSLKQYLKPGMSATVSGKLSNFPVGHRLRRFYPSFFGGHRIWLGNLGVDGLLWGDPGAPQGTYTGEKVTWAEVATFVQGGISHTLAPLAEDSEVLTITDTTPKVVTTKVGAVYYDPGTGAKVTQASSEQKRTSVYATAVGRCIVVKRSTGQGQLLAVKAGDPNVSIATVPEPPKPTPLANGLYKVG